MEKTRHKGNQPVCNELPYIKHFREIACKSKSLDAANYFPASADITNCVHGSASQFDRRSFRSKVVSIETKSQFDRRQESVQSKTVTIA